MTKEEEFCRVASVIEYTKGFKRNEKDTIGGTGYKGAARERLAMGERMRETHT